MAGRSRIARANSDDADYGAVKSGNDPACQSFLPIEHGGEHSQKRRKIVEAESCGASLACRVSEPEAQMVNVLPVCAGPNDSLSSLARPIAPS